MRSSLEDLDSSWRLSTLRRGLRRDVGVTIARAGLSLRFVLLFPLHSPILEPNFDLPLGETQCMRDLDTPPPGQISVEVELLLQLQRLVTCIRLSSPFPLCNR